MVVEHDERKPRRDDCVRLEAVAVDDGDVDVGGKWTAGRPRHPGHAVTLEGCCRPVRVTASLDSTAAEGDGNRRETAQMPEPVLRPGVGDQEGSRPMHAGECANRGTD